MPDADRVHSSIPPLYRRAFSALSDESSPSDTTIALLICALRDDLKATGNVVLKAVHQFGILFEDVKNSPLFFSGEGSIRTFDSIIRTLNSLSGDADLNKNTLGLFENAAHHTFGMLTTGRAPKNCAKAYANSLVAELFRTKIDGLLHLAMSPTIASNHLRQIREQVLSAAEKLADQLTRISDVRDLRLPPNTRPKLTLGLGDALPLGDGI